MSTTTAPKVVRSGWCNPSHPLGDWAHKRCSGDVSGAKCPCVCHDEARTHYLAELARYHALGEWLMANRPREDGK